MFTVSVEQLDAFHEKLILLTNELGFQLEYLKNLDQILHEQWSGESAAQQKQVHDTISKNFATMKKQLQLHAKNTQIAHGNYSHAIAAESQLTAHIE